MPSFDPTVPQDSETPRLGASRIRSLTGEILQWFGFTGSTAETVAQAPFSVDAAGNATLNGQPLTVQDPVQPLGVANKEYVDANGGRGTRATATGTNTLVATLSPAPASQSALVGIPLTLVNTTGNTDVVTLNVNSFGAQPVKKWSDGLLVNLEFNDLPSGCIFIVVWDGGEYQLISVANQVGQLDGMSGAFGLSGSAAGGGTTITLSATYVVLHPFTSSNILTLPALSSSTLDISTSGPAINGRDQSAAFGNGSTVHVYAIWNPATSTAGLIASLNGTRPAALPTGFTNFGYLTSFIMSGANIPAIFVAGNTVFYTATQTQRFANLTGGTSNTQYSYATSYVPANAILTRIWLNLTQQGAGVGGAQIGLLVDTGNIFLQSVSTGAANNNQDDMEWTVPNTGSVFAGTSSSAGTTTFNMYVLSYTTPLNQ
jgi:hypothetical protein